MIRAAPKYEEDDDGAENEWRIQDLVGAKERLKILKAKTGDHRPRQGAQTASDHPKQEFRSLIDVENRGARVAVIGRFCCKSRRF